MSNEGYEMPSGGHGRKEKLVKSLIFRGNTDGFGVGVLSNNGNFSISSKIRRFH